MRGVISFRALDRGDFPLLRHWLNTPHVYEWWGQQSGVGSLGGAGPDAASADDVEAKYGPGIDHGIATQRFIIVADQSPIGLIQWYRLADYADYAHDIGEGLAGTAGVDLLIGEPTACGRGLGSGALDAFVATIVFRAEGITRVVAGPAVNNARSIRTFEKAGFIRVRDVAVPGEPTREAIMVRDRP
ncbi:MAG: aminoglycoside 6-N-acetyltransferase [Verrucomicrobia bacterium]|nr:aminoglycoside 6-N-acetyltransferase [Verrucomicrobiota bacterium]